MTTLRIAKVAESQTPASTTRLRIARIVDSVPASGLTLRIARVSGSVPSASGLSVTAPAGAEPLSNVTITASGASTYTFTTTGGTLSGTGATRTLSTPSSFDGEPVTVTVTGTTPGFNPTTKSVVINVWPQIEYLARSGAWVPVRASYPLP